MAAHKHPNYMAIFWYLAILTVIEIGVVFLPFGKVVNGTLLCALAVGKAALVAMYFMHLRFETKTLGMIAISPLVIATLLVFVLLPDGFAVAKKTDDSKKVAPATSKH
jgi:cytochrome c oxidase subunit 4